MAVQGGGAAFLEKVAKMVGKQNGRPVLKASRPLALKDSVTDRRHKKGEATCVTELSVMMACWKEKSFVDSQCSKEVISFHTCVKKAQERRKDTAEQSNVSGEHLTPKQVTTLLRRYPNLRTEI